MKIRAALYAALRPRGVDLEPVDPWYYPAAEKYSALLERIGFAVEYIELIPRPTELPGDILNWLQIFAQLFTRAVEAAERQRFLIEVRQELEPKLRNSSGIWVADYVRLRFRAKK